MKFLDFFSGIGGFRLGLEQHGFECVGYCEIDKYARKSYEAIHETEKEWRATDITRVRADELPEADIYCAGFPCQAFSIAGKQGGFEDTRGTLVFEVLRLAKERQPNMLFFENVKGLLSHDNGRTFSTILAAISELGYDVEWQLLNSKNFGVPQNRERVFIIGHLRGTCRGTVFPITGESSGTLKEITSGLADAERIYDGSLIARTLKGEAGGGGGKTGLYAIPNDVVCLNSKDEDGNQPPQQARVYDINGHMTALQAEQNGRFNIAIPVLTPDRAEKRQNGRRFKDDGEPMFTLTGQDKHGVMIREATKKGYDIAYDGDSINMAIPNSKTRRGRVGKGIANTLDTQCNQGVLSFIPGPNDINNTVRSSGKGSLTAKHNHDHIHDGVRIRRLTPLECFRLQGFPDSAFYKAQAVNSNSQLYKQAGNSVTVNVISAIAKSINQSLDKQQQ